MKILVVDTETTGLPTERNPSIFASDKWPYIIQLSYILYDTTEQTVLSLTDNIVKIADSVELTEGSVNLHLITREKSKQEGVNIVELLKKFNTVLSRADIVVGHNISFDKRMLMVECIRHNIRSAFNVGNVKKPEYCTMKNSIELCKIERTNSASGETYYKYPTLSELYNKLFGKFPHGVHNSLTDILVCLRCYIWLTEKCDVCESVEELKRLLATV